MKLLALLIAAAAIKVFALASITVATTMQCEAQTPSEPLHRGQRLYVQIARFATARAAMGRA